MYAVHRTVVYLDGPNLRNIRGPLDRRPFGRVGFVHLDGPYNSIWTVEPSSPFTISNCWPPASGRFRPTGACRNLPALLGTLGGAGKLTLHLTQNCFLYLTLLTLSCTLHCKLYPVLYTVNNSLYSVQCTVYSVQCTLYSVQCTVYSVQ